MTIENEELDVDVVAIPPENDVLTDTEDVNDDVLDDTAYDIAGTFEIHQSTSNEEGDIFEEPATKKVRQSNPRWKEGDRISGIETDCIPPHLAHTNPELLGMSPTGTLFEDVPDGTYSYRCRRKSPICSTK